MIYTGFSIVFPEGWNTHEKKEKREIYFFDHLAKNLYEDAEALAALKEYHNVGDIFRILQDYGYLIGMSLDSYLEIALQAGDDLKYFLDPETGDFSEDAISNQNVFNIISGLAVDFGLLPYFSFHSFAVAT